eukprot:TRINITY_DN8686_c0_g1_i1.p2 TRINITY_DN8686_c0_g1~~TRINITY_DN8686_c0_g1_i1.p2  ORF type:complete len:201 (+),score=55.39 TRINITY_DN8686_c0_g1_i1:81-683(+)
MRKGTGTQPAPAASPRAGQTSAGAIPRPDLNMVIDSIVNAFRGADPRRLDTLGPAASTAGALLLSFLAPALSGGMYFGDLLTSAIGVFSLLLQHAGDWMRQVLPAPLLALLEPAPLRPLMTQTALGLAGAGYGRTSAHVAGGMLVAAGGVMGAAAHTANAAAPEGGGGQQYDYGSTAPPSGGQLPHGTLPPQGAPGGRMW